MKKILLPILATIVFIVVVGFLTKGSQEGTIAIPGFIKKDTSQQASPQVIIKGNTINVEVADTDAERRVGLSNHTDLEEDQGMFFTFPKSDVISPFWMKDMKMSIDIIWINDTEIVQIDREVAPEPGVADSKLKLYKTTTPIDYVLEVASGWATRHNVLVGDKVEIKL